MQIIIEVVNKGYNTQSDLENLITYALEDKHPLRLYYYDNFFVGTITAYEEMIKVQNCYGKTENRLARHFIVSFDDIFCIDAETAVKLAYKIAHLYSSRYQIVFAVHDDTEHIHVHFILSTVNFVEEIKFIDNPIELSKFKGCVEYVVNDYEDNLNY